MADPQAPDFAAVGVRLEVAASEQMRALGARLAEVLMPGDLVVLDGPLGAGKTTLVQGIGTGLGVRGPITSPTFVIARLHPSLVGGPDLVHADAYRLGSRLEVDDLDLDADVDHCVTVVEWGEGLVEALAASHLLITIGWAASQAGGSDASDQPDEPRVVTVTGYGDRWETAAGALISATRESAPMF
jgi:tRNA threonylcarbamoyladenosine biosynthesis protein TsaE